jgi:DNA-binding GntR family transcriptional regulator
MPTTHPVPERLQSKQQQAYAFIKARIDDGVFAPNQRLVIDSLARDLSMSQVPVREAIRRLEAEGLVTFSTNAGAVVAAADPALWSHFMEMLALLEGYVTGAAAAHITPNDIAALREINKGMADALAALDFERWTQGNEDFHRTINMRCGNQIIAEQIVELRRRLATISRFVFPRTAAAILHTLGPESGAAALRSHQWIIAAFEAGTSAHEIELHSRQHILSLAERTASSLAGRT